VAYHYRGHFIYAYPAGNPIEPVPFSTKKGINIVGIVQDRAPIYDPQDPDLVPESQIAALQRACMHEQEFQREQKEIRKQEVQDALEEKANQENEEAIASTQDIDTTATLEASSVESVASHPLPRATSFPTLLVPQQVISRHGSNTSLSSPVAPGHTTAAPFSNVPQINTAQAPNASSVTTYSQHTLPEEQVFTPHDRGHYLAQSAPGSRQGSISNTPYTSRPVSPTHGLNVRGHGHGSHLRPNASTSRLNQLLAEEGFHRAFTPISEVSESVSTRWTNAWEDEVAVNMAMEQDWIDPDDIDAFVQTVSHQSSPTATRPGSRPLSRIATFDDESEGGLHLPGLGHPNVLHTTSRTQSPIREGQMVGRRYLPGLGHPDVLRSTAMRSVGNLGAEYVLEEACGSATNPPSRKQSPFPGQTYDSENSAEYLRRLAEHNYARGGPLSRVNTPSIHLNCHGGGSSRVVSRQPSPIPHAHPTETFTFPLFRDHATPPFPPTPSPNFSSQSLVPGGRSRAASLALNEAYNATHPPVTTARTPKCTIHDEICDGQTTTEKYVTQRAREGAGFVNLFPTVEGAGGVVFVDWHGICQEMMGGEGE
jgi:hypothetical protein